MAWEEFFQCAVEGTHFLLVFAIPLERGDEAGGVVHETFWMVVTGPDDPDWTIVESKEPEDFTWSPGSFALPTSDGQSVTLHVTQRLVTYLKTLANDADAELRAEPNACGSGAG
jgi:hypothetical protein